MANRTDKEAASIHGTNPQNLVEYIIRQKIYDSVYWKQHCFGLSAELVVEKASELRFVGGMFGEPQKPTDFICLALKMLQIQPAKEIVVEFIKNDDFKYLRLLGAFYMRLTGRAVDVYQYLEPLLNDYRRVRVRNSAGGFELAYIDAVVDDMLRQDYMFNIALPKLPSRRMLEKVGQLETRVSVLEEEFNEAALAEEAERADAEAAAAREAAAAAEAAARAAAERHEDADRRGGPRQREKWKLSREEEHRRRDRRRGSRSRSRSRSRERGRGRRLASSSRSRSRSRGERRRGRDRDEIDRHDRRDRDERDGRDRRDSRWHAYDDDRHERSDRRRAGRRGRSESRSRSRDRRRGRSRSADGRREKRAAKETGGGSGGSKDALTVEQTNDLRSKLGLAPLK